MYVAVGCLYRYHSTKRKVNISEEFVFNNVHARITGKRQTQKKTETRMFDCKYNSHNYNITCDGHIPLFSFNICFISILLVFN